MARVLLIKTSSLGDVVHALPAVSDIASRFPDISIDWVVEEAYRDIACAHPSVNRVIPVAIRRWRQFGRGWFSELLGFKKELQKEKYDTVIDAQGLIKSALITSLAKGRRVGFDASSVRERPASWFYDEKYSVPKGQHAVERVRQLFSQAFGYHIEDGKFDYCLNRHQVHRHKQVLLIHGTTWPSKLLPESLLVRLAAVIARAGFQVLLPWGNETELERARRICADVDDARVLPAMTLASLMQLLKETYGAISVDTGLGHLAVALGTPTVSVYGPTSPFWTGTYGPNQSRLVSNHLPCIPCLKRQCKFLNKGDSDKIDPPCYEKLNAETIWKRLCEVAGNTPRGEL